MVEYFVLVEEVVMEVMVVEKGEMLKMEIVL